MNDKTIMFTFDQYQETNVDQASGSVILRWRQEMRYGFKSMEMRHLGECMQITPMTLPSPVSSCILIFPYLHGDVDNT